MIKLSVIIPALNEAGALPATLARVRLVWPEAEVIVVDGGSADATRRIARDDGARVRESEAGRGRQVRRGAAAASGDWLFFLHADTLVPLDGAALVEDFARENPTGVATFRLRFDSPHWFLRGCAWFTRFDTVWTRFGDQGILVSRAHYHHMGGFPEWPLFEDVEFLRRARRLSPVVSLPAAVVTSPRCFEATGHLRQQWRNARLLGRFLRGESPHSLAQFYLSRKIAGSRIAHETSVD